MRERESGFSLIELMLALGISALILLVTSQSIVTTQKMAQRTIASANNDSDTLADTNAFTNIQKFSQQIQILSDGDQAFKACVQNIGSNCRTQSHILPPPYTTYKRDVNNNQVVDSKVTVISTCSGSGCTYHTARVEAGLFPLPDGTINSSSRDFQIPNFLVAKNTQLLNQVDFSCSLGTEKGNLMQISFLSGVGSSACATLTGSMSCSDGVSPLLGFGGTGSAGCLQASTVSANCPGGIQSFSLQAKGGSGVCGLTQETDNNAGLGNPPQTATTPTTQGGLASVATNFGSNGVFQISCPSLPSSSLKVCLGTKLQDYLNQNDCVIGQQTCPSAFDSKDGRLSFVCRCISPAAGSSSAFPQYCVSGSSNRPFSGSTIQVGPSYSHSVWYMDLPEYSTCN